MIAVGLVPWTYKLVHQLSLLPHTAVFNTYDDEYVSIFLYINNTVSMLFKMHGVET